MSVASRARGSANEAHSLFKDPALDTGGGGRSKEGRERIFQRGHEGTRGP